MIYSRVWNDENERLTTHSSPSAALIFVGKIVDFEQEAKFVVLCVHIGGHLG